MNVTRQSTRQANPNLINHGPETLSVYQEKTMQRLTTLLIFAALVATISPASAGSVDLSTLSPEAAGLAIATERDARDLGFHDFQAELRMVLKNRNGQSSERLLRSQTLEQVADGARRVGVSVETHVLIGHPSHDIIDFAEHQGSDLIVIATHGLTGLRRFFLGSVAEKVVQSAPCPVFTVKGFGKRLLPQTAAVVGSEQHVPVS